MAASPEVAYIWEPFHLKHRVGECAAPLVFHNTCVTEANEGNYLPHLKRTLSFQYNFFQGLLRVRRFKDAYNLGMGYGGFLYHRLRQSRPLLKDPRAVFSAEWLADRFDADVVVTIRHPAALAGSLKVKGWHFPFADLLNQPQLMETYLGDFSDEISAFAEKPHDIVDQATLLWKLIHHTIDGYRQRHPDWLFIRHEDLSRDPIKGFQAIFDHADLDFSSDVIERVKWHSGLCQGPERQPRKVEKVIFRDSAANVYAWKNRLTEEEIKRVRERVGEVARNFYDDGEW